jgi:hypothetical protein
MHPEPLNPTEDARVSPTADALVEPPGNARINATGDALVEPTGDDRVDAAVAGLAALDELELADHPAVLEAVHDRLRDILGELGDAGRPTHSGQTHVGQTHGGPTHGGTGVSSQGSGGPGGDPRP